MSKLNFIQERLRMQKIAGIISEVDFTNKINLLNEEKKLKHGTGLLLKLDQNTISKIKKIISQMPDEPNGNSLTPLPDDDFHVTLTSIKSFKPIKDKFLDFDSSNFIFPEIELGKADFVYRDDGKVTYVVEVKNQNDLKNFVDTIYQKVGENNPEPDRFFHITLANNQGGNSFKSIGNVTKSDLIKENNNNNKIKFFFDLDGVLADMQLALDSNNEILELKNNLKNLIDTKFPEYKGLVDDKIKEKLKREIPPDSPPDHPLRPLKKAFNRYNNKIFQVAAEKGFYRNLSLLPGAKEMVSEAYRITGNKPNILSSPILGENSTVNEKIEWVKEHFGDMVDEIIIDTNKGEYASSKFDVLIDDRPKYIKAFENAGGTGILHQNYKSTIDKMNNLTFE